MLTATPAGSPDMCLQNACLLGILRGDGECQPACRHASTCSDCLSRLEAWLDLAAATTCLQFSPRQWEAFRRLRLLQQPVHQVSLELAMPWREVWDISSRITTAILRAVDPQPPCLAGGEQGME